MLLSPIASTVVAMLLLVLALALSLHYVSGGLHAHGPILSPESWYPSTGHLVMTMMMDILLTVLGEDLVVFYLSFELMLLVMYSSIATH